MCIEGFSLLSKGSFYDSIMHLFIVSLLMLAQHWVLSLQELIQDRALLFTPRRISMMLLKNSLVSDIKGNRQSSAATQLLSKAPVTSWSTIKGAVSLIWPMQEFFSTMLSKFAFFGNALLKQSRAMASANEVFMIRVIRGTIYSSACFRSERDFTMMSWTSFKWVLLEA